MVLINGHNICQNHIKFVPVTFPYVEDSNSKIPQIKVPICVFTGGKCEVPFLHNV